MKIIFLSFVLVMLYPQYNQAQNVVLSSDFEIKLGEPYKVLDASHTRYFFPTEKGRAVSIKRVKERMIVQVFDTENLKEIARNDYREFPKLKTITQSSTERLFQTKTKLYHFLYVYDTKSKVKKMQVRIINTKTAAVGRARTLFQAEKRIYRTYMKLSPDSSSILLGYSLSPSRKDNFEGSSKEFLYVYDAKSMQLQWKKNFMIPPTFYNGNPSPKIPRVTHLHMNSNNTVTMTIMYLDSKDYGLYTVSKDKTDFQEKLIPYTKDISTFNLSSYKPFLHSLSEEHNNLIYWSSQGTFSYQLSLDGKLIANNQYKYPVDFMVKHETGSKKKNLQKKDKKGKAEIEGLTLIATLNKADGGALFIGETRTSHQSTTVMADGSTNSSVINYEYGSLILTSLKENGSVEWAKKIPKNQVNKSNRSIPFYIGTQCILSKDKKSAYLFYLDTPENLDITSDETPKVFLSRMMGGFLVMCKVDIETGKYEKHLVADMSDIETNEAIDIEITNIFHSFDNDAVFLMEARFKKKDALIKIKMKK